MLYFNFLVCFWYCVVTAAQQIPLTGTQITFYLATGQLMGIIIISPEKVNGIHPNQEMKCKMKRAKLGYKKRLNQDHDDQISVPNPYPTNVFVCNLVYVFPFYYSISFTVANKVIFDYYLLDLSIRKKTTTKIKQRCTKIVSLHFTH